MLIYSTLGKVIWESGKLDAATMRFEKQKTGELDLGAFYAPKTQLDAQGRRILWGWIQEKRTDAEMKAAGWSGMMALPRVLNLDKDGVLRVRVLPQAAALRAGVLPYQETRAGVLKILPKASGEVWCTGTKDASLVFVVSGAGERELLRASYSPESHSFVVDGKEVVLQAGDLPSLHAYVDGSVIELIVSERIGYTKRFYYPDVTAPDVTVLATGSGDVKMIGWKIAPISANRLTT